MVVSDRVSWVDFPDSSRRDLIKITRSFHVFPGHSDLELDLIQRSEVAVQGKVCQSKVCGDRCVYILLEEQ